MERIPVPGATLAALSLGEACHTPVVMLHGLATGNMATWYSKIAASLSATRQVILYDQRGHGDSSAAQTGFDLDRQSADLQAVLAHYGYASASVDLVGHSMGALIALRFALRYPQSVRRLILVDAPMPANAHVAPSLLSVKSEADLQHFISAHFGIADDQGGRRRTRLHQRLAALLFSSTMLRDIQAMEAEPAGALAALPCPVLLVYGAQSPCLAAATYLQTHLPNAQKILLNCGHYVPEEAPDMLCQHVTTFLTDRDYPAHTES